MNAYIGKVFENNLNRCYNRKYPEARYYSGAGVTVCERWLRFDFFLEDMSCLPGWNYDLFQKGVLYLDKDKRSGENRIYSPQTCSWLTATENHPFNIKRKTKV